MNPYTFLRELNGLLKFFLDLFILYVWVFSLNVCVISEEYVGSPGTGVTHSSKVSGGGNSWIDLGTEPWMRIVTHQDVPRRICAETSVYLNNWFLWLDRNTVYLNGKQECEAREGSLSQIHRTLNVVIKCCFLHDIGGLNLDSELCVAYFQNCFRVMKWNEFLYSG